MHTQKTQNRISSLFASLMVTSLLLTGCGGSGSDTSATSSTTVNRGVITGFGSVYVNGIKFETQQTEFTVDNNIENDQSNLKIGMVVTVNGTVNADGVTGTATSIQYDNELKGPISNISPYDPLTLERTFTVLGKTITANADTIFDDDQDDYPLTLETLADGNVIEISGLVTTTGLTATHIEGQSATLADYQDKGKKIEILGTISNFAGNDLSNITFDLGSLSIQTTSDTKLDDLRLADLQDSIYIEVKGDLDNNGVLTATEIEAKSKGLSDHDVDEAEIEGIVTAYDETAKTLEIQGQSISFSTTTEFFPNSLTLMDGMTIEAEGRIENGVLIAEEIKQKGNKIKIKSTISNIDLDNETITFNFNDTDIIVRVNAQTELEVDHHYSPTPSLSDFYKGDFVAIKAFDDGTQTINAVELELEDANEEYKIQAAVESYDPDNHTITVLGVEFDLSQATFKTETTSVPVGDSFYNTLSIGEFVELKDNDRNGTIDEVEFDD